MKSIYGELITLCFSIQVIESIRLRCNAVMHDFLDSIILLLNILYIFFERDFAMASSSNKKRLRILHISDLHERGTREQEPSRRRRVLGDAWERNLDEFLQDGPVHLILFTGDVADWGKENEYQKATEFFDHVLEYLNVDEDRLFIVPGNHDINRETKPDIWKKIRDKVNSHVDDLSISRWMSGISDSPPGFEDEWRDMIIERQSEYRKWISETLQRPDMAPSNSPHGFLGYRNTINLPGFDFDIHIIGFDTSWLCGDDNDEGKLLLTDGQIGRLCTKPDGDKLYGLRIAMMHHPLHTLKDGGRARNLLANYGDLILRGHLHEEAVETYIDPDRKVRYLASGCLYEGHWADQYRNSCHLITLNLDTGGKPRKIHLRFRSWSPRGGHWYDEDGIYRESRGGRLSCIIQREETPTPRRENPFNPWTPVTPPRFVGRKNILRRLEEAMKESRSVSLVGEWRSGKSSVLQTWAQKIDEMGRVRKLVSGEGPEGISPFDLVNKNTGDSIDYGGNTERAADALKGWAKRIQQETGFPPVILIDEADGIIKRFEYRFFERLRGMLGDVIFVLSTRREVDKIYEERGLTSPFENRMSLLWVPLLDQQDADTLKGRGGDFLSREDIAIIDEWAGRHPFFIQLLGRHLVDARRFDESIERAMEQFKSESASRFRTIWLKLTEREKECLIKIRDYKPTTLLSLKNKALITEQGNAFGRVLVEWMKEEI